MLPLNLYARVRFCLCILRTRPRVQRAPGLPCALSVLRRDNEMQNSGRIAPRDREVVVTFVAVIARSTCDEAIQLSFLAFWIASLARNDVEKAFLTGRALGIRSNR